MTVVRHPALGLLGLIAVGLLATKLWTGDLTVAQAAVRLAVVACVLLVAERFVLPVARSLVLSGQRRD